MSLPTPVPVAPAEPWVDIATIGKHLGFARPTIKRMAEAGQIQGIRQKNGKRTYWRFKISQVDAAMNDVIERRKIAQGDAG